MNWEKIIDGFIIGFFVGMGLSCILSILLLTYL